MYEKFLSGTPSYVPNLPPTQLKLYERIKQKERDSEERQQSPSAAPTLPSGWYSSDEEGDSQKDLEIITLEDDDDHNQRGGGESASKQQKQEEERKNSH